MELRDYQKELANKATSLLKEHSIAYIAAQVRVGKSLISLETARLFGAKKVLFITKLKAISSIEKDYQDFKFVYKLKVINYEQAHKETDKYDLYIIDEAHSLGAYPKPSGRAVTLKELCSEKPIIFLSGTPTPESYSQMYHQFYVSNKSPWKEHSSFYKWFKIYGIPRVKYVYNRQINDYTLAKKDEIMKDVNHLIITFTQEEAGFESFVEEEILYVPMDAKVRQSIKMLKRDKILNTKDGRVILADTAVKEMQKIHQLCSGTIKCEDGSTIVFDNTKALFIKERFEGQKIAIFYKFIAEMELLKQTFGDRVITNPVEFNKAGKDAVFISQVVSGREGINLSSADALVMYNIDFSALSYWQSRARMQTKDRTQASKLYWIFTEGGIEDKVLTAVSDKKDFTVSYYKKIPLIL